MFGVLKFVYFVFLGFRNLLNVDRNALSRVPNPTKYLVMVMLSCFWCLAFGLYIGELMTIGYNMIGHIALVSMAVLTWKVFRDYENVDHRGVNFLRQPDRSSRCDEYTDEQRAELARRI